MVAIYKVCIYKTFTSGLEYTAFVDMDTIPKIQKMEYFLKHKSQISLIICPTILILELQATLLQLFDEAQNKLRWNQMSIKKIKHLMIDEK